MNDWLGLPDAHYCACVITLATTILSFVSGAVFLYLNQQLATMADRHNQFSLSTTVFIISFIAFGYPSIVNGQAPQGEL